MMAPTVYHQSEILHPDMTTLPDYDCCYYPSNNNNNNNNRTVYNYNPAAQIYPPMEKFYVYEPAEHYGQVQKRISTYYIEDILKKNSDVWQAYISGRFDVLSCLEDNCRKIILKEKSSSRKLNSSDYNIRKYTVRISHHEARNNKEILVVQYDSHNNYNYQTQAAHYNPPPCNYVDVLKYSRSASSVSLQSNRSSSRVEHIINGPGSELIAELVEGDDDEYEITINKASSKTTSQAKLANESPVVHELVGNYFLDSADSNLPAVSVPPGQPVPVVQKTVIEESSQAEEESADDEERLSNKQTYTQQSNQLDSFDEEYIQQFAPLKSVTLSSSKSKKSASRNSGYKLTGSPVTAAANLFQEDQQKSLSSVQRIPSQISKASSRKSKSNKTASNVEVEVYNLSPLPSPRNSASVLVQKQRETPASIVTVSSKTSKTSSKRSTEPVQAKRLFVTSSAVTPAPPNPFAFTANTSPISQTQFVLTDGEALTDYTETRQTPVYAPSTTSSKSRIRVESSQYDNEEVRAESGPKLSKRSSERPVEENQSVSNLESAQVLLSPRPQSNRKNESVFDQFEGQSEQPRESNSKQSILPKRALDISSSFSQIKEQDLENLFKQIESKYAKNGKIPKSKLPKVFKKLGIQASKDELEKAAFLIGVSNNFTLQNVQEILDSLSQPGVDETRTFPHLFNIWN